MKKNYTIPHAQVATLRATTSLMILSTDEGTGTGVNPGNPVDPGKALIRRRGNNYAAMDNDYIDDIYIIDDNQNGWADGLW